MVGIWDYHIIGESNFKLAHDKVVICIAGVVDSCSWFSGELRPGSCQNSINFCLLLLLFTSLTEYRIQLKVILYDRTSLLLVCNI